MALEDGPGAGTTSGVEAITAPNSRGWYWRTLFSLGGIYAEVVIVALAVNLLALALPLLTIVVFDRFVPYFVEGTLWLLASGIAIIFAFDFALKLLRSYFVDSTSRSVSARIGDRLFKRILAAKMAAARHKDELLLGVPSDLNDLRTLLSAAPLLAIIDLPFVCIFIAAIYAVGGPVALIPLIAALVVLFLSLVLQLPLHAMVAHTQVAIRNRLRFFIETVTGLETLKSQVSEATMYRRWEDLSDASERAARMAQGLSAWITTLTATAVNFVTAGVIVYGVILVNQGALSVGGLVAVAMLAASAMAPLSRIAEVLFDYHRARVAIETIDGLMQLPAERLEGSLYAAPGKIRGAITFQNVSFHYAGQEAAALDGVTFQIDAGEKVGILGRIGAGKSTIARLILGFFEPTEGVVAIDGADIQNFDPAELRANIGCVLQDIQLFEGSVRDNIAIGMPQVDDEAVARVARIAGVDEFVNRHPLGYEMPVGARALSVSMGQRQAIGIARSLLRDPPILLFDEPTASLDNTSEGRFRARLSNSIANNTLLLITNRASMLSLVDRLIVIDGGKIIADGARQEVLDALQGGHIQVAQGLD
jgi:ATP-binding cassette subfamily C protein LapB